MLTFENVSLAVGSRTLVEGVSWTIHPGQRVGLIGRNGTGKSTLLRAIVGEAPVDEGKIHRQSGAEVGYLPQQAVSGSSRTLWEEGWSGMRRIRALKAKLEAAEAAVAAHEPHAIEALDVATESFRLAGGFAADEKVGEVLHGLGFSKEDWARPCTTFSGGWQMRIALARLLLSDANVLLLDEPTNHLDLAARSWLADFLATTPHTVLIVSHDRHLLDHATNVTAEVRFGRLEIFNGPFSAWLKEREQRTEQQKAAVAAQQEEIARLQGFIDRFGAKATKASQAQSRKKQLEKIERIELPEEEKLPRLKLAGVEGSPRELLLLQGAKLGWPDRPIIDRADLIIERGMRLAVLGPNGAGKSTLLKGLSGQLPLLSGRRLPGKNVRIGVFSQDLAQELPMDLNPVQYVESIAPTASVERIRAALGALGLPGGMALQPIGALSGGEKARVALACFALRPHDLLLLDEPTNHLDIVTVEVLVQALKEFPGAMVLVSHDRYLVESLATHVARVGAGRIEIRAGLRPEDFKPIEQDKVEADGTPTAGAIAALDRKARQKAERQTQKRIAALGDEIEKAEAELSRIDEQLCQPGLPFPEVRKLGDARAALSARIEALFTEWAELEER